ncbi:hypothetical protein ACFLVR_03640 [Chloroflexota bacterium]
MLKRHLICLISIITLIALVGVTACKLPTADEMRQPDYGAGVTEAVAAQAVIDEIAALFDDLRDGTQTGTITQAFTEAELTALIAQKMGSGGAISNVLINIEPDAVLLAADLVNEGETKAVVAEFNFVANGDTIAMTLGSFTYGGLLASLVPAAKTAFEEQLNSGLQSAMGDPTVLMSAIPIPEGATVDSIVLALGVMTVTGTATFEAE